jgi:anthranilate synthase component 1
MRHFPDFETFCQLAKGVQLVPVYRRLAGDLLTPVTAFHKLDHGSSAMLFESVVGGESIGRYSFLTAGPFLHLEARGKRVSITSGAQREEFDSDDPLVDLQQQLDRLRSAVVPGLPPFCGGAVGYAGYDTVRYVENLPNAPTDDRQLPDLSFSFFDTMIIFDHATKTITVVAMARLDQIEGSPPKGTKPGEHGRDALHLAYEEACAHVDQIVARLETPDCSLHATDIDVLGDPTHPYTSNFTPESFAAAVEKCLEYIRAGDIFQVVISQRLQTTLKAPPFELYRTLRVVNPSPFMFYLRMPQVTLVGSSPEIMVRVVDNKVTVRPLAGTRKRGRTPEEDMALEKELLADPKEIAEHVMLVDLGRNDVGRVARYGSVELSDVMVVERYSHVMHITSNVTGELAPGKDAFDALKACLPAGTVSGAPKVRAMEIIDELEPHRRGPYAGAVGYVDFTGNMDTCIALRTVVIQGDQAYVQAGAGIVADSVPESEYQETLNKARAMLKAIELTERRVGQRQQDESGDEDS